MQQEQPKSETTLDPPEESVKSEWTEFSFILRPSPISGLGVFITHDIPANTLVFLGRLAVRQMKVSDIPADFLQYCIYISEEECLCPARFDRMEIAWYLNHSDEPNVQVKFGDPALTLRDLKAGEEVLMDYNAFAEPENLKDAFYRHAEWYQEEEDEDEEIETEELE